MPPSVAVVTNSCLWGSGQIRKGAFLGTVHLPARSQEISVGTSGCEAQVAGAGGKPPGRSQAVTFLCESVELRGSAPAGPALDRLLTGWPETDPPILGHLKRLAVASVIPLLLAVALFVGHRLSADIPWWAFLIGLGLAGLLYLVAGVQILRALLENSASFYGAQMSAMDNATRNAGDMIRRQTLTYNRTRQAMITKELIEIISGAEAL